MTRILLSLLIFAGSASAQDLADLQHFVHDVSVRLTSAEGQYTMPEFEIGVTAKDDVNASADVRAHKIWINIALARVFYGNPGEMAFVIAHEIGHLQDADCHARMAKQNMGGPLLQRECEATADFIGMQYLLAAGFSAYDAAGAMGRLMMASPRQNSVVAVILGRFTSDHPVSMDRIKQLAEDARQACEQRPEICR